MRCLQLLIAVLTVLVGLNISSGLPVGAAHDGERPRRALPAVPRVVGTAVLCPVPNLIQAQGADAPPLSMSAATLVPNTPRNDAPDETETTADSPSPPPSETVPRLEPEPEQKSCGGQQQPEPPRYELPDERVQAQLEGQQRRLRLRRKREALRLSLLHLGALDKAEPACGWTEAAISLYRHVLPSLGRTHINTIMRATRTETIVCVRSARDASSCSDEEDGERSGVAGSDADASDVSTSSFSDSDQGEEEGEDEEEEEEAGGEEDDNGEVESAESGSTATAGTATTVVQLSAKQRIIGAITWERIPNDLQPRQRLVQLTLVGCRTKYQGLGVATRLMREIKDPRQVRAARSLRRCWRGLP
jgi:hypothetical protein